MEVEPGSTEERATRPTDPDRRPPFRRILAAGFRTTNAVWLAPVLLFAILAPQQTGLCAEILALRSSGRQLPPWLIAAVIIGHASLLWLPILFFSLPWVVGGAAARFRDHRIPPDRRRSYVEQANAAYGRSLALFIPFGVVLATLFLLLYAYPLGLRIRDRLAMARPVANPVMAATDPGMIASAIGDWFLAAIVVAAWTLAVASAAVENVSPLRAIRRTLSFVHDHPADAARFYLFVTLIGLPNVLLQHATFLIPVAPAPLVLIAIGAAAYVAYAIMLYVAVAQSLHLARRPSSPPELVLRSHDSPA